MIFVIRTLKATLLIIIASLVAACQTTTARLSPEQISTYALTDVDVKIDSKTKIKWAKYHKEKRL